MGPETMLQLAARLIRAVETMLQLAARLIQAAVTSLTTTNIIRLMRSVDEGCRVKVASGCRGLSRYAASSLRGRYSLGSPCKLKAAQKNGAFDSGRFHISNCAWRRASPYGSFSFSKFR